MCDNECDADNEIRKRAVPTGTVGGLIAGTHTPRRSKAAIKCKADSLRPTISG